MAAFDAKTRALLDFLEKQAGDAPTLAGEYAQMTDLYSRKLWHQLTLLLESFVKLPAAATHLQPLYETFVVDFKHRLNKLALARVQVAVAKQLGDTSQQAFFCKTAAEEAGKDDRQARAYLLCELARLQLDANQVDDCKAQLEDAGTYIESAAGLHNDVQAAYYRGWAGYYKIKGPAAQFYKHALLLLAYAPLSSVRRRCRLCRRPVAGRSRVALARRLARVRGSRLAVPLAAPLHLSVPWRTLQPRPASSIAHHRILAPTSITVSLSLAHFLGPCPLFLTSPRAPSLLPRRR